MRRRRTLLVGGVVAAAVATLSVGAGSTTAAAVAAASCESPQLQRAPVVTGDVRDDGTPVAPTDDRRGKRVPVVLVAGAGDDSTVDAGHRTGPFAHPVDQSSGTTAVGKAERSLLGELQNLPGTDVYTFDTSKWNDSWVDDDHLGPALGNALDCLHTASGEKALVVTHSTGSLVARWALTHAGRGGADRASEVSTVVTFGSPESGSTLGLLAPGGVAAAERAGVDHAAALAGTLRLLAAHCAAQTSAAADGSLCDQLDRTVPLATTDLGRALAVGSSQLSSLPAWPSRVAVQALTAGVTLTPPGASWFGAAADATPVAAGDLLDLGPALPEAAAPTVTCGVTVSGDDGGWTLRATDSDDPGAPVEKAVSACLSADLTRNADLVVSARATVLADLFRRQPLIAADLQAAPVPPMCQIWPTGVLAGGVFAGPSPDPDAEPPTLRTQNDQTGKSLVAFGDLDGDGVGDAAAVVSCTAGGVSWPDYLVFWGSGLRLLGAFMLGDVLGGARNGTRSVSYTDGKIAIESLDARDWDAGCCASGLAKVVLGYDGSKVVADDVQHLQGPNDITFTSVGKVRLGMSDSDLRGLGMTPSPNAFTNCIQYSGSADSGLPYVVLAASHDEVVSIVPAGQQDFLGPHTFPEGIGVGSSLAQVTAAYSGHTVENHLDGSFGQGSSGVAVEGDGGWISFAVDTTGAVSFIEVSNHDQVGSRENPCA